MSETAVTATAEGGTDDDWLPAGLGRLDRRALWVAVGGRGPTPGV